MSPALKKRLPFLAVLLLGVVLWRGGFGLLPSERTLVWRLPVSYSEVRAVDLQVWEGEALLKRVELFFPHGIGEDLSTELTLSSGEKRLVATATSSDGGTQTWTMRAEFAGERVVVVSPK